ncbi:glycoside hydrolase family 88 protein [Lignipirellula cremea]|uniref:Unsaturated rhamnogalacturonyl hydrolase YesR n=1 Tax=Lignipirellula cremea TaxID=2528010 RepID=A0A518E2G6_9BACT|nr:glycoside hydrolase family 88 protein [Lignipirellula cremea]QDU98252.1 Unsaturated rhamnogalacturonyl hydrolase YesR [Lignipirellula cremea]
MTAQTFDRKHRVMTSFRFALTVAMIWTACCGGNLAVAADGTDLAPLVKELKDVVVVLPIGVDSQRQPIDAVLPRSGFNESSGPTRVLLVGRPETASAIVASLRWFYTHADAAPLRSQFLLSAVPQLPESDKPAAYPPAGGAYTDDAPQAMYAWRWIGMQAPDAVLVVEPGESLAWFVPPMPAALRGDWAQALKPTTTGRDNELAAALVRSPANDMGLIPAVRVNLPDQQTEWLATFLSAVDDADPPVVSPARQELRKRLARTPLETATLLAKPYGHDLGSVVYIPSLALLGRVRLGELTNDPSHAEDVRQILSPYLNGQKTSQVDNGSALSGHLIFSEMATRSQGDERAALLKQTLRAADMAFDEQGRPKASMPFHSEMSDALFMGAPILAAAGQLTGDPRYYDASLRHLRFMRKLVLRDDGLYRHSPLDEAAWGRGNGFPALGLALCLSYWPADRADRPELLAMFQKHMAALAPLQDEYGCFHQVVDRPDTYREFTSTCMITFAAARGVREGWLDRQTFAPLIARAWPAINARIADDGRLVDVCTGTGKQKDLQAYYHRPAILGRDSRGGAMALLATTEMAAYDQSPPAKEGR